MPPTAPVESLPTTGLPNMLLSALPGDEQARLARNLEPVHLGAGTVLYEPGCRMLHGHFLTGAVVSRLYTLADGRTAETAVVGREGIVGISLIMGSVLAPSGAVVQVAGSALRIAAPQLVHEFNRAGALMRILLRYTQALMAQTSQTALCNRHHRAEQQLCRWLLLRLDRLPGSTLDVTQESIAQMLGLRRESVTEAAHHLQAAGLIDYRRGHIVVLRRAGLEERCCECYAVVRREYARLLGSF